MTDAAEAYRKITETRSLFFSRGDNSGTHKKETSIWDETGIAPNGDWYRKTGAFMGNALKIADENKGYFMTDRSTYISMKDDIDLEILSDPNLVNYYSVIAVNPEKYPKVNYEMARPFIEYVVSLEGQTIIENFGIDEYGEPLYHTIHTYTNYPKETVRIMVGR
jgi:ABC-type tungstate transport system, permease component